MRNQIRQKEIVRGKIIYYLSLVYPHPTTLTMLQGELDIFGYPVPMDDMNFHVAYLAEKGLVATERRRGPGGRQGVTLVTITARGIDYRDGRLPADEGIYMEPQS
jgi:hypothetical protein